MQHNGVSKICGAKCRADLEQSVENIPAAVKGVLDDIYEKFMQHQVDAAPSKKDLKVELSRELLFLDHYPPFFPSRFSACIQPDCFVSCVYD